MGMIFALAGLAFAAPSDLARQWARVEPTIRTRTEVPVPLSDDAVRTLLSGEVSAARFETDEGSWATGAIWIDAPIERVWLAINDGEHDPKDRTTLRVLDAPPPIRRVHLTLHLPFPIADRQWVSDALPNRALYDVTEGRVWQRQWKLSDRSLAVVEDRGVWLLENRGAWTLLDTTDGTLLLFTVRTALGGLLPASITQGWAVRTLRSTLRDFGERAKKIDRHYVGSHRQVADPSGSIIRLFPR